MRCCRLRAFLSASQQRCIFDFYPVSYACASVGSSPISVNAFGGATAIAVAAAAVVGKTCWPTLCSELADGQPLPSGSGSTSQALPSTTRLLIIRHGESLWNVEHRLAGRRDIRLNDIGLLQARRLAEALEDIGATKCVDAVVSSDLSRASDTADEIARMCPSALRRIDARLREVDFGDLEGRIASEVKASASAVFGSWKRGEFGIAFPGGESADAAIARGLCALREAAELGACVIVVSHGCLIKWCAVHVELGEELPTPESMALAHVAEVVRQSVGNCCCSTLVYDHATQCFRAEVWFKTLSADD